MLRILKRPTKYSPDSNAPETWHNIKEWKRPFFSFSGNEYDLVRSKSEYAAWILVCGPFHCERITISAHELIDSVPEFDTMEDILDYVENEVPFARVNDQNGETIKVSSTIDFVRLVFALKLFLSSASSTARSARRAEPPSSLPFDVQNQSLNVPTRALNACDTTDLSLRFCAIYKR